MNKKGFEVLSDTLINIIIGIIGILILFGLFFALISLFSSNNDLKKAEGELGEMKSSLERLNSDNKEIDYLALYTPEWNLFSSEYADVCKPGPFCLCICEERECSEGLHSCISNDKFAVIKVNGQASRYLGIPQPPIEMKMSFIEGEVYPIRVGKAEEIGFFSYKLTPSSYLRFNSEENEWQFSYDLEIWKSISEVESEKRIGEDNANLIRDMSQSVGNSKENGENYLRRFGFSKSEGLYILDTKVEEEPDVDFSRAAQDR